MFRIQKKHPISLDYQAFTVIDFNNKNRQQKPLL